MSDKTDKIKRKKKKKKIIKYRKPLSVNIGFIVFFAIFAYILIYMAMYFTRDRVSIYEVVYGKNADQTNKTYQALLLRTENQVMKLSTQTGDPVRLVFNDTKKELRFNLQGRIVRMVELDETKVLYGCRLIIKNTSLSKYIADKQREQLSVELKKRQELKTETVDRLNEAFHKK